MGLLKIYICWHERTMACRGDFYYILSKDKWLYGATPHEGSMEDFATTLFDCGLAGTSFEGNSFTWTNSYMFQRLDRVVYNQEWAESFTITRIQHLNMDSSNHCPILISCSTASLKGNSSFHFLHAWTKHHVFFEFCWQ